jgi:glutamate--cysteine ligase
VIQDLIHKNLVAKCKPATDWFESQAAGLRFPFYSSYDVRDSGIKVAPVDANLFPAGFNNICQQDKDAAVEVIQAYFKTHYPGRPLDLGLITEEHTNNSFYWENVCSIRSMLVDAGAQVRIALPRMLPEPLVVKTASGKEATVFGAERLGGRVVINGHSPELLISNNDFSESYEDWSRGLETPMNPPRELGWYRRRKHQFFEQYNRLAGEFADVIGLKPFQIQVETEEYEHFDITDDNSRNDLAKKVDSFIDRLAKKYAQTGIDQKPFAFVKNNAGTYGLAVIRVSSGEDVLQWNYKSKKRMKAAKGGRDVTSLIIQEGVPTRFHDAQGTAEPCIYLIGSNLVGGFLRTHAEKGDEDNLNSPGAVYKKLCMSDMATDISDCPMEAVYGWISRLAALAVANEVKAANIQMGIAP